MVDAVEPVGQNMHQEAADELWRCQAHDLLAVTAFDPVVFPAEGHGIGIRTDQTMVRDRDPVGVAAQVGEDCLGPSEGRLGVVSKTRLWHDDHPFAFAEWGEPLGESILARQMSEITEEGELAGPV